MASNEGQCQALQLSDGERCQQEATNANGLFCKFHAKQVYGLYKGYKRRNAQLDAMDGEAPPFLKGSETPLANENFSSLDEEKTLREVHSYLFDKYVLIGKVIDARKLHHKHFYSLEMDYGHQAYLDKLSSQRYTILQALERLEKRTAEVLYQKQLWFTWVRKVQDEEDAAREKEQKKVKQEAALFKRHWETLKARVDLRRKREEEKRQEAYLEKAYQKRMGMASDSDDESWDPIEDIAQDNRDRYIDLIKNFLWMDVLDHEKDFTLGAGEVPEQTTVEAKHSRKKKAKAAAKSGAARASDSKGGSSSRKAATQIAGQERLIAVLESSQPDAGANLQEPDKSNIETKEQMRKRLGEGVKKVYEPVLGPPVIDNLENPRETYEKTAPMTDDEIETAVKDIEEIKLLLFCRLLLGQASLLPAALRAKSVQEFFNDATITQSDLRDLCLKVEKPTLQEIRDACADFARGDEADENPEAEVEDEDEEDIVDLVTLNSQFSHLQPRQWLAQKVTEHLTKTAPAFQKQRKKMKKKEKMKKKKLQKIKITICGKSIWNHASERAMSRDGWLQFSIMAKDCHVKHAFQLCRNWAEFSELSLLILWQYFPASNWSMWGSDSLMRQLLQLGFIPYFIDFEAHKHSSHNRTARPMKGRRAPTEVHARNIIAGHMKRNDPVTRRFLQYLMMRTGEVLLLVRDGKTGRVITAPPVDQLWTYRKKRGSEWENVLEVGPEYFDKTALLREWHFGFDDYYDVFIWDFLPNNDSTYIYNVITMELQSAWRLTKPVEIYKHMEPLLRSLTREETTMRTRQIKRGEEVTSLWDTVTDPALQFYPGLTRDGKPFRMDSVLAEKYPYMFYNASNVAEDAVLFPEELDSTSANEQAAYREINKGLSPTDKLRLPSKTMVVQKGIEAMALGLKPHEALESAKDSDEWSMWVLPEIWTSGLKAAHGERPPEEKRNLLQRVGLAELPKSQSYATRVQNADELEMSERETSFALKEALHDGDLEPGSTEKFLEAQQKVKDLLAHSHSGPTDWVWFLAGILDWLKIRADYKEYAQLLLTPWPHSFIIQDLVRAFANVAMFFPNVETTALVTRFLQSQQCESFRNSDLFKPEERCKTRPDRRSRTSYKHREKGFWKEWEKLLKDRSPTFPMEWSLAIRPIIAHLYKAGIIAPAYVQNHPQFLAGRATANSEAHRPDKLDLFIDYNDKYGSKKMTIKAAFTSPDKWPDLRPHARKFSASCSTARFALLRLWSAPHYYPMTEASPGGCNSTFLDSLNRSWKWMFMPKDMPGSEYILHHFTMTRLKVLQAQFEGRVVSRGDLVLVMGDGEADLLRYCTAVTFCLTTKPWRDDVDLWKSFVNVDMEFLDGLDAFWWD